MALGSPLDRIKLGKWMGGSGQTSRILPQLFSKELGTRKNGFPSLFILSRSFFIALLS